MHMPELWQQGDAGSRQGQQGALPDREENPVFWQMRDLLEKRAITEKQAEIARIEAAIRENLSPAPDPVEAADAPAAKGEADTDFACPVCGNIVPAGSRFCNLCGLSPPTCRAALLYIQKRGSSRKVVGLTETR